MSSFRRMILDTRASLIRDGRITLPGFGQPCLYLDAKGWDLAYKRLAGDEDGEIYEESDDEY